MATNYTAQSSLDCLFAVIQIIKKFPVTEPKNPMPCSNKWTKANIIKSLLQKSMGSSLILNCHNCDNNSPVLQKTEKSCTYTLLNLLSIISTFLGHRLLFHVLFPNLKLRKEYCTFLCLVYRLRFIVCWLCFPRFGVRYCREYFFTFLTLFGVL